MRRWAIRLAVAVAAALFLAGPTLAAGGKGKHTPEERFKHLDTNSDNKVTLEEFKANVPAEKAAGAEKHFKHLDTNSDGSLSLEEFKAGLKKQEEKK